MGLAYWGVWRYAGKVVRASSSKKPRPYPVAASLGGEDAQDWDGEEIRPNGEGLGSIRYQGETQSTGFGEGKNNGEDFGFSPLHHAENQQVSFHQKEENQTLELWGQDVNGTFFSPQNNQNYGSFTSRNKDGSVGSDGENVVNKMENYKTELLGLQESLRLYQKGLKTEESKLRRGEGSYETVQARLEAKRKAVKNTLKRIEEIETKIKNFKNLN